MKPQGQRRTIFTSYNNITRTIALLLLQCFFITQLCWLVPPAAASNTSLRAIRDAANPTLAGAFGSEANVADTQAASAGGPAGAGSTDYWVEQQLKDGRTVFYRASTMGELMSVEEAANAILQCARQKEQDRSSVKVFFYAPELIKRAFIFWRELTKEDGTAAETADIGEAADPDKVRWIYTDLQKMAFLDKVVVKREEDKLFIYKPCSVEHAEEVAKKTGHYLSLLRSTQNIGREMLFVPSKRESNEGYTWKEDYPVYRFETDDGVFIFETGLRDYKTSEDASDSQPVLLPCLRVYVRKNYRTLSGRPLKYYMVYDGMWLHHPTHTLRFFWSGVPKRYPYGGEKNYKYRLSCTHWEDPRESPAMITGIEYGNPDAATPPLLTLTVEAPPADWIGKVFDISSAHPHSVQVRFVQKEDSTPQLAKDTAASAKAAGKPDRTGSGGVGPEMAARQLVNAVNDGTPVDEAVNVAREKLINYAYLPALIEETEKIIEGIEDEEARAKVMPGLMTRLKQAIQGELNGSNLIQTQEPQTPVIVNCVGRGSMLRYLVHNMLFKQKEARVGAIVNTQGEAEMINGVTGQIRAVSINGDPNAIPGAIAKLRGAFEAESVVLHTAEPVDISTVVRAEIGLLDIVPISDYDIETVTAWIKQMIEAAGFEAEDREALDRAIAILANCV